MPAEWWTEASQMLAAGALVAAVALPLGAIGWVVSRRRAEPLVPGWKPWRVPWGGFEVAAAFLVVSLVLPDVVALGLSRADFYRHVYGSDFPGPRTQLLPPVEASAAVAGLPASTATHADVEAAAVLRQSWAGAVALPLQLGLVFLAVRALYPAWKRPTGSGVGAGLALGVLAWAVLTPLVLAFNLVVNVVSALFDAPPESHQFTSFVARQPFDPAVFLFRVSVAAAVVEELVFRGLILPWTLGGRKPTPAADIPSRVRPWCVAGAGVMFAALTGRPAPVVFALILFGGLIPLLSVWRSKRRTVGAVYASAAFFATVHSSVWPSPVPLFVFGLGLGWLAVRTRGILVPALVHGLFNAVSGVFVLRGGAG